MLWTMDAMRLGVATADDSDKAKLSEGLRDSSNLALLPMVSLCNHHMFSSNYPNSQDDNNCFPDQTCRFHKASSPGIISVSSLVFKGGRRTGKKRTTEA